MTGGDQGSGVAVHDDSSDSDTHKGRLLVQEHHEPRGDWTYACRKGEKVRVSNAEAAREGAKESDLL